MSLVNTTAAVSPNSGMVTVTPPGSRLERRNAVAPVGCLTVWCGRSTRTSPGDTSQASAPLGTDGTVSVRSVTADWPGTYCAPPPSQIGSTITPRSNGSTAALTYGCMVRVPGARSSVV